MKTKFALTIIAMISLSGCAHKELKAPCTDALFASTAEDPCGPAVPVNGPQKVAELTPPNPLLLAMLQPADTR